MCINIFENICIILIIKVIQVYCMILDKRRKIYINKKKTLFISRVNNWRYFGNFFLFFNVIGIKQKIQGCVVLFFI